MITEGPIGDLLHLLIFVAGAGLLGVIALAVIERLAEGGTPRIRTRHVLISVAILMVLIGVEVAFHLLGGS